MGTFVGVFVGFFVGAFVGCFVGFLVGALVGALVGRLVGPLVGADGSKFARPLVLNLLGSHFVLPTCRCKDWSMATCV